MNPTFLVLNVNWIRPIELKVNALQGLNETVHQIRRAREKRNMVFSSLATWEKKRVQSLLVLAQPFQNVHPGQIGEHFKELFDRAALQQSVSVLVNGLLNRLLVGLLIIAGKRAHLGQLGMRVGDRFGRFGRTSLVHCFIEAIGQRSLSDAQRGFATIGSTGGLAETALVLRGRLWRCRVLVLAVDHEHVILFQVSRILICNKFK